jgi:hypothetical protein
MARKKWNKKKRLIRQARAKPRRRLVPRRVARTRKPAAWLSRTLDRAAGWVHHFSAFKPRVVALWRAGVLVSGLGILLACLVPSWKFLADVPPQVLWRAYPGAILGFQQTARGWIFLLSNGLKIPFRDGLKLSIEARLDQADLETILSQPYFFGEMPVPAGPGVEPGRFRNYDLFKAAYGGTPDEVKRNLVMVDFLGLGVEFNAKNGAAQALQEAAAEIQADPEAAAYVKRVAGNRLQFLRGSKLKRSPNISSWNWRCIAGTQRLSAHSFGIALDLNKPNITLPAYWRWLSPRRFPGGLEQVKAVESVTWRVVGIFEKHGFIWGGKWHHFDTMHFEYRPEFLAARGFMPWARNKKAEPHLQ